MHTPLLPYRRMARGLSLTLLSGLLLAACGGGHDDTPVAMVDPAAVPPSATVNSTAFSGFVGGLASSDSGEPLNLDGVEPPTSETDEPVDVT